MAQSTPTNSYCPRASFRCAYMHHIEKYVFQQESAAPGLGLLLNLVCNKEISIAHIHTCISQTEFKCQILTD